MDAKNFAIGILVGVLLMFAIAATKSEIIYESELCEANGTCIYTILDTKTGQTKVFQLNPARGHLVLQKADLSIAGEGDWTN